MCMCMYVYLSLSIYIYIHIVGRFGPRSLRFCAPRPGHKATQTKAAIGSSLFARGGVGKKRGARKSQICMSKGIRRQGSRLFLQGIPTFRHYALSSYALSCALLRKGGISKCHFQSPNDPATQHEHWSIEEGDDVRSGTAP